MTPRQPASPLDRLAHLASYPTNRRAFYRLAISHFADDDLLDRVLDLPDTSFATPSELLASASDGRWWRATDVWSHLIVERSNTHPSLVGHRRPVGRDSQSAPPPPN